VKPDERLVARAHVRDAMSDPTCRQDRPHNFAVEQTAGSRSLARGCSPRRYTHHCQS
jgi:hypothetical protein